jgi:CHAT domain-containing protein
VLPFEALVVRNGYLVERFAVATIPSVHMLAGRDSRKNRETERLLAIADPRPAAQMRQLPYSDDEVASAARAFAPNASTVLAGATATRANLLKLDLSTYTNLHFATHSTIDYDDPWRSKIWLSQDSLDREANDFLALADIRNLRLPAALVVLSSCESGGGSFELSEGLNGFVRAFLEAGTQNLVVSLWEVEDFATAGFMASFYRHLHLGYAAALQLAKKEMIASPRRKHRHPYYWSPFLLTTVNPTQR